MGRRPGGGRKLDCAADGPKKKVNSAIPETVYKELVQLANRKNKSLSWVICEVLTLSTDQLKK